MIDTVCTNARILLDVLEARGIRHLVISPGSRNAPLIISAEARKSFKRTMIDDERTAGFYALGLSTIIRQPVVLICTSGTAFYNYAPAIAEAYYQHLPLIVVTADRPSQWIDQDDSQTLRQPDALENIVKRSYDIPFDGGSRVNCANPQYATEHEWFVNRIANEACLTATDDHPGPVHINIQLAAPLGKTEETAPRDVRTVEVVKGDGKLSPETAHALAERLADKRVMVVAGFMPADDRLNRALSQFTAQPNVTLLSETISNLHLANRPWLIDALLTRLTSEQKEELAPDVVISIGGSLVSRMLKEYLRHSTRTEHWTLSDTDVSVDCFQRLSMHIDVSPRNFFNAVGQSLNRMKRRGHKTLHADYAEKWNELRRKAWLQNEQEIANAPWSELKALHKVFGALPLNYNVFLSNGTPIRYAQLVMDRMPHGCYCNRGVSGIDGTSATALGAAAAYAGTTLLITGDMSFAYCPEVLHLMDEKTDLRIIVINNRGGGIFRFIDTTRNLENREECFCSDPQLPVANIARAYGWNYLSADNEATLKTALKKLYTTRRTLLEIFVDPQTGADTLIDFLRCR